MREASDWPAPVDVVNEEGASDVVLLCEHASNHVPAEYNQLGLSAEQLHRHIAWDIGAAEVCRRLSHLLDAPAFLGTYSRLVIDLNRPLSAADSMPATSEGIIVPANAHLDAEEAARRVNTIFAPFHQRVASHLDQRIATNRPTRLVSIHSFTPVFFGVARRWHAGVLFAGAAHFGNVALARLQHAGLLIEANEPYKTDRLGDYAIPIHGDDRGIPAIMLEIRNDEITDTVGADWWARWIANSLDANIGVSRARGEGR
ncbi:MAG: N-formylglutamate amidohydrolase [Devosia sp.]